MASRHSTNLIAAGAAAPDFRLSSLSGSEVTLGELTSRGRVVLCFFKISCPVCQMAAPFLERLHRSGGLAIVGVSQNGSDATREFNQYYDVTFPVLLDSEDANYPASNSYGIANVPTLFVVEPDGLVSRVIEGWNKVEMEALGAEAKMTLFQPGDNVPAWKAG